MKTVNGDRMYSFTISVKYGWQAKYLKEVDVNETTTRFRKEIYDNNDILRETHEKFPVDKGHKKIKW